MDDEGRKLVWKRTRSCSAFFSLSEATGLGGTWSLLEGAECLGCDNPSMSTRTPSALTLEGEHLKDDESSFEVAVFKGPAEPLCVLLEGATEPLDAILWVLAEPLEAVLGVLAEPLSVSEEHLADLHGTQVSADTILDFPEEAWVPVETNPGPPEERTFDSVVLSGRSENTQVNGLTLNRSGISSDGSGSGVGPTSNDHSQHLGFNQLSGFRKWYVFLNADKLNLLLLLPDWAIFSRWSVGTIAIWAQLGSLTLTFMLIFSTTHTLRSNLAMLACVSKLVAVEATHRVRNKQGHLHL